MKYIATTIVIFGAILVPSIYTSGQTGNIWKNFSADQEVHINKEGKVVVTAAKVIQVSGTTVYAQSRFGSSILRWLLPTSDLTRIKKRFGGSIKVSDIAIGDNINFEGVLNTQSDALYVLTSEIINWSRSDEQSTFSGTIAKFATTSRGFVLAAKEGGTVTVLVGATTTISKGKLSITMNEMKIGDKILETSGTLDVPTKTLKATNVVVYQNTAIFQPRNFQGILKSLDPSSKPLSFILTIDGKDYTVRTSADVKIWNTKREAVLPQRYVVGDTVRIYGAIRDTDFSTIDAEIVRNISL